MVTAEKYYIETKGDFLGGQDQLKQNFRHGFQTDQQFHVEDRTITLKLKE